MDTTTGDGYNVFSWLIISAIIVFMLSPTAFASETIGWVENVYVSPGNVMIKAKIDTGADSSSLHCDCTNKFFRNGEEWVKFTITGNDGRRVPIEKKIVRSVKVKRHFGDVQRRDVVRLGLCISGQYEETDVSLIDRSRFKYDMLIGRKFLRGKFIVDSSLQFSVEPRCDNVAR